MVLPVGIALGAGSLIYYFFMYNGKVEQKAVNAFRTDEDKIVEREHQASKVSKDRQAQVGESEKSRLGPR